MIDLSRFKKEMALHAAGIPVPAYPAPGQSMVTGEGGEHARSSVATATAAWNTTIDLLYFKLICSTPETAVHRAVVQRATRQFADRCLKEGLQAAVRQLNKRVPHRFTAIVQLAGAQLRVVSMVDKLKELEPDFSASMPLEASFCQFVLRQGTFRTDNSETDERLVHHPYRGVIKSYHGAPVADPDGKLLGTACHIDYDAKDLSDSEYEVLKGIATGLYPYL